MVGAVLTTVALFAASIQPPSEARDWDLGRAWCATNGALVRHSLNAYWRFRPADANETVIPLDGWGWFLVPGRWRGAGHGNLMHADDGREMREFRGRKVEDYSAAWYRRTFEPPTDCVGRCTRLYFELLDSALEVRLNGKTVPFEPQHPESRLFADVTEFLRQGERNELLLRIAADPSARRRGDSAGVRGNIWLETRPFAGFGEPIVRPLVRERRIAVRFVGGRIADSRGRLRRRIVDRADGSCVYSDEVAFRAEDVISFVPAKAWSPSSPDLYDLELTLTDGASSFDARTVRFGWRDFRAEGGRFLLNGRPVDLFADTGWPTSWTMSWNLREDYVRRTFRAMKAMNVTALYADGWMLPDAFFDWADEEGVLLLYRGDGTGGRIHDGKAEEYLQGFAAWAENECVSPSVVNHPSLIGLLLDVWYNYHDGTKNPAFVGLDAEDDPNMRRSQPAMRKVELERIAGIGRRYFPELETFTGADGHVGHVYGTHLYHTWGVPPAELAALFETYSKNRRLPVFAGEMCLPYHGSFSDLRNWVNDVPLFTENAARFLGHRAAELPDVHVEFAARGPENDLLAATSAKDPVDGRKHLMLSELYSRTVSEYIDATVFPWRYDGVSGIGFFEYLMSLHLVVAARDFQNRDFQRGVDLTSPGDKAEQLWGSHQRPFFDLEGDEIGLRPNYATDAFLRATDPVSLAIVGDANDRYAKDHAYFGGETVAKGLAFVNASENALKGTVEVTIADARRGVRAHQRVAVDVDAYSNRTFAVRLRLPQVGLREDFVLRAVFIPDGRPNGEMAASQSLQVFPPVDVAGNVQKAIRMVDGSDALSAAIGKLGFTVTRLSDPSETEDGEVVVFAPHALENAVGRTRFATVLKHGGRVLTLEQGCAASPEIRTVRSRRAFLNAPAHPALAGLSDEDFADWRGGSCSVPAYGERSAGRSWIDWGGRNMVAANVFRRPLHGNVTALLVSGFDLHDAPLLEYRSSQAHWIASELEIGSRIGIDPVATHLFVRLVRYLSEAERPRAPRIGFIGSRDGRAFFDKAGVQMEDVPNGVPLSGYEAVVVSDPDWRALRRRGIALARYVADGGNVFCLHAGREFSSAWLPFVLTTGGVARVTKVELRGAADSVWRNGWGAGDLYWNAPVDLPTFADVPALAETTVPAVLLQYRYGRGRYVFSTLTPDLFGREGKEMLTKPAIGKVDGILSAVLGSLGVEMTGAGADGPFKDNFPLLGDLTYQDWSFAEDGPELKWRSGQTTVVGERVRAGVPWSSFLERDFRGVGWYRLSFTADSSLASRRDLFYVAHSVSGADTVWLNGRQIGAGADTPKARVYRLPTGALRAGENELRIRLEDRSGKGGLRGAVGIHPPDTAVNRVWTTPWPDGVRRDYSYPCDLIRFY